MRRRTAVIVIAALILLLRATGASLADAEQGGAQGGGVPPLGSALAPTAISVGLSAVGQETDGIVGPAAKTAGTVTNVLDSMHTCLLVWKSSMNRWTRLRRST